MKFDPNHCYSTCGNKALYASILFLVTMMWEQLNRHKPPVYYLAAKRSSLKVEWNWEVNHASRQDKLEMGG